MSQLSCPPAVHTTLQAIRDTEEVNMFDTDSVQQLAAARDADQTVTWIEEHPDAYLELVASWP